MGSSNLKRGSERCPCSRAGAEGTGGRTLRGHGVLRALRAAGASVLPAGGGLAGSPRKRCPAGDRKLKSPLLRWHPSCHRSAGPKRGVIRGPQRRRGAQLAALALSAPHRSRGAVGGRGSGSARLPDYFWAWPQTDAAGSARLRAVPGVPRGARPCRQLRAGTFPAVPSRHRVPTGAALGCPSSPSLPLSSPPAASSVRHPPLR